MALKAGRVGVAPSEVDNFGKIIGGETPTDVYTKEEADAKFVEKTLFDYEDDKTTVIGTYNGKTLYRTVIKDTVVTTSESGQTGKGYIGPDLSAIDKVINMSALVTSSTGSSVSLPWISSAGNVLAYYEKTPGGKVRTLNTASAYNEADIIVIIEYTKQETPAS